MTVKTAPARYVIEVSGAELDVVRLALGRMVEPKPTRAPRRTSTPRRYVPKPPRLTPTRFADVSCRWERACADPARWRVELADGVAAGGRMGAGYTHASDVFRAWGLDEVTGL
jgi:hypothetical protein